MKHYLLKDFTVRTLAIALALVGSTSTAVAEEKVVWEGSEAISWNSEAVPGTQYETPDGTFTGLEEGDIIRIYTTTTYGDPQYVVTYKKGDKWDWTDLSTTVSEGTISYTVEDATTATEIAERGLILRGQAWTATKITVESAESEEPEVTYIETTVWTGEEAVSWSEDYPGTQFETPAGTFTGLQKDNIIKVYTTTTYESPQYVLTYKAGNNWDWTDLATTVSEGIISYTVESDQIATEIAERGLILRGQAWTATKITVSAIQEEEDFSSITLSEDVFPAFTAGTYETVNLKRTLLAGYNTIILPFATTAAELTGSSNAYAATIKTTNEANDELTFVKVDAMEANKPYLLFVDADVENPSLSYKTLEEIPANYWDYQTWDYGEVNGNRWYLQGNYTPSLDVSGDNNYVVSGTTTIAPTTTGATLNGLRAYLVSTSSSDVKSIRFVVEDTETGITETITPAQLNGHIYNLAGQRVLQPRHGIYVVNGKKIMR